MKICVVGLGLIGGSLCMALKRAGYSVDGWNRSDFPVEYALKHGAIDSKATIFTDYDLVFVALPPDVTLKFITQTAFKDGAVVSDICGVKKFIEDAVFSKQRNFNYVGCHPMAGKEVSGIENACADLFDRANMIITSNKYTDGNALETLRKLTEDMGFARIVECSAVTHDRKIAYTSQLAHIVSNAYVKDAEMDGCMGFTGGSFQDMTRIAGVDEYIWAELYMKNAVNLSEKVGALITSLQEIKSAVDSGDETALREVLRRGRLLFDDGKKKQIQSGITVKNLK